MTGPRRAVLQHVAIPNADRPGNSNVYDGLAITISEVDGSPFGQTIYANATGGATTTAVQTTDGSGFFQVFTDQPRSVLLTWAGNSIGTLSAFVADQTGAVETYSDKRPWFSPRDFGALANGSFDDGPAMRLAQAALDAAGGGTLFLNAGDWTISSLDAEHLVGLELRTDNVTIRGDGESTRVSCAVDNFGMFYALNRSGLTVRDLHIDVGGSTATSYGVSFDANPAAENWTIEGLTVSCNTTSNGIGLINGGNGALDHVRVTDTTILQPTPGASTHGLTFGTSGNPVLTPTYGLTLDNVYVDGFGTGIFQSGIADLRDCHFVNLTVKNAMVLGMRTYHCGGALFSNCSFIGNHAGLYMDDNGSNQWPTLSNCKFINNTVTGLYSTEWGGAAITGSVFHGNGQGIWLSSGTNCVVSGCTITGSTGAGILIDRSAALDGINLTIFGLVENLVIADCNISENGTHGVWVKGVRRACTISGGSITRNGQSSGGPASSSGFADIAFESDSAGPPGTPPWSLSVAGTTLGNVADGTTSLPNGLTQYAVLQRANTVTYVTIEACTIFDVAQPIVIANGTLSARGNTIVNGTSLALPTATYWEANAFIGGTLASGAYDRSSPSKLSLRGPDIAQEWGSTLYHASVANGQAGACVGLTSGGSVAIGRLTITDKTNGKTAIYQLAGANDSLLISGDATYWRDSVTGVAALKSTVKLFAGVYKVQNDTAARVEYLCEFVGNAVSGGKTTV